MRRELRRGLIAQAEATRNGCDQVAFLDAAESRWIEELGGMNVFFVVDGVLVTPPLGTILPGVTRESIISIAEKKGIKVEERPYPSINGEKMLQLAD